jgi:hypothetical protein
MTLPAEKKLLWVRSTWTMTSTDATRSCLRRVRFCRGSVIPHTQNGWAAPPPVYIPPIVSKAQGWREGGDNVIEEQQGEVARGNVVGANIVVVVPPSVG